MSNYPIQENPTLTDQFLIWDQANSSWKRAPFSSVLTLFQENTDVSDSSIHLLYPVVDSANITYALPDATAVVSRYVFKRTGTGTGKILFSTVSAQTIDGATPTNFSLSSEESIILYALEGQWYTENNYKLKLNPSRIAMQELTSDLGSSLSGWITIAEVSSGNSVESVQGECIVMSSGGYTLSCEYAIRPAGVVITHQNSTITIKNQADSLSPYSNIIGFRLAKSDTSTTSGLKLQVNVSSKSILHVQLLKNISRSSSYSGMQLITATQANIGLLPDGVTAATFLEAGAELSFGSQASSFSNNKLIGYVASADSLRVTALWEDTPKQGTGLTISITGTFSFNDPITNTNSVALGSYSISNFAQKGKEVTFIIAQTGIATGMTVGRPSFLLLSGSDGKLTITG